MPAEAEAPPDLVTPLTASAAASAPRARCSRTATVGRSGSSRSRSGIARASAILVGEPRIGVLGRDLRHRHRALREFGRIGLDVVGRHHGLAAADEHAQADIVALGSLGFLDRALAHLDGNETPRTAMASAASAPAVFAASTRRSASSVRAD